MFGNKVKQSGVTNDAVMAALSTVIEPDLHRDLVSLNMIRNLEIDGNNVTFTIMLTTPACPLRGKMEGDSRAALLHRGLPEHRDLEARLVGSPSSATSTKTARRTGDPTHS